MKIVHIISGDLWAGAEALTYNLLIGLSSCKEIELSVIVLNEGKLADLLRKTEIPVLVLDEKVMSFFEILKAAKRILHVSPPDIIHSHRYKENFLSFLISKLFLGSKIVATQHGMPELYQKSDLKKKVITKLNFLLLSKLFDKVIAVSDEIRLNILNKDGFKSIKVSTIRNGVLLKPIKTVNTEKDDIIIGSAGRLSPVKDYSFFVEIAKDICSKKDNVKFRIAGDGPEMIKLKKLVKSYSMENCFEFLGNIDEMSSFYSSLYVYLNTSIHEGIPMTILESMVHGTPVIAPSVGGVPEIIDDGVNGFLVQNRTPESFSKRCLQLIEDKKLRDQFSAAGKKKIQNDFSMDRMVQGYLDVYRSVLAGSEHT